MSNMMFTSVFDLDDEQIVGAVRERRDVHQVVVRAEFVVGRVPYGHVGVSVFASMALQELDELGYFHVCLPPDKFSYKAGGVRPSELRAAGPGGGLRSSKSVVCCGICWQDLGQYLWAGLLQKFVIHDKIDAINWRC